LAIAALHSGTSVAAEGRAKIGTQLQQRLLEKSDSKFDVLVYLSARADLSGAKALKSKEAKGKFVHQALLATSRASQTALRRQLADSGIEFKSYYIANMIAAFDVSPQDIMRLASRD